MRRSAPPGPLAHGVVGPNGLRPATAVAVAVVAATVILLGGCASSTPTSTASAAASSAPAAPRASGTPVPAGSASPPATGSGAIGVDADLLGLLPTDVAGVPLTGDPATAADIAADPILTDAVVGVAVATAFGPLSSDAVGDYVVVTLARLREGVFDETFFRDWRDTFDAAVCAQAGGVDGHAEADIEGHATFIATCAGGVRTYHTHLAASDVIVSMQALGEGRYGERVVAGLTE